MPPPSGGVSALGQKQGEEAEEQCEVFRLLEKFGHNLLSAFHASPRNNVEVENQQ
jgi:hypothetical protein